MRIYRARLPYLNAHELQRKKITPPSSPGVGTVRHYGLPRYLRPNTKGHNQWNILYNSVCVAAVRPTRSCSQDILGGTSGHLMQVEAGKSDNGA